MLGDRHRDARDVHLLERISAQQIIGDIAGDGDHRNAVHVRGRDAGDQVGRSRAAGGQADPGLPGAARIAPCSWEVSTWRISSLFSYNAS